MLIVVTPCFPIFFIEEYFDAAGVKGPVPRARIEPARGQCAREPCQTFHTGQGARHVFYLEGGTVF